MIRRYDNDPAAAPGSAFIDPYVQIDPNWLGTHPGYSLAFDAGVSNAPLQAVPEPSSAAMMLAGAGALMLR